MVTTGTKRITESHRGPQTSKRPQTLRFIRFEVHGYHRHHSIPTETLPRSHVPRRVTVTASTQVRPTKNSKVHPTSLRPLPSSPGPHARPRVHGPTNHTVTVTVIVTTLFGDPALTRYDKNWYQSARLRVWTYTMCVHPLSTPPYPFNSPGLESVSFFTNPRWSPPDPTR